MDTPNCAHGTQAPDIGVAGRERNWTYPGNPRRHAARNNCRLVATRNQIAARYVAIVSQHKGDSLPRTRMGEIAVRGDDSLDAGMLTRGLRLDGHPRIGFAARHQP